MVRLRLTSALSLLALACATPALAAEPGNTSSPLARLIGHAAPKKTAYAPSGPAAVSPSFAENALVFSAPPRESAVEGVAVYTPVAEYLSKALGRKIVYKHPGTWGAYRSEMLKGGYDLIFDGPHFNAYRAEKLNHNILVKAPEQFEFAIIVRNDGRYSTLSQMAGRTFCTHAPPNLGTLVLLSQFDNPARQPAISNTEGWDKIYAGVASGRCSAGVLPVANLKKLDKQGLMKVVFKSKPMQNQAFSAGPRLNADEQAKLAAALIAPEAATHTEKLRTAYRVGPRFVTASNQEYAGLSHFLRNEWGYF